MCQVTAMNAHKINMKHDHINDTAYKMKLIDDYYNLFLKYGLVLLGGL